GIEIEKSICIKLRSVFLISVAQEKGLPGHPKHLDKQQHENGQFIASTVNTYDVCRVNARAIQLGHCLLAHIIIQEKAIQYVIEIEKSICIKLRSVFLISVAQEKGLPGHPKHLDKQQHENGQFIASTVNTYDVCRVNARAIQLGHCLLAHIIIQEKAIQYFI